MLFTVLIACGIFLRFLVMACGHNYDWESYCIVGEIAGNFRNVYAETSRYNYGFIFFCIQGLLYRIAQIKASSFELIYRILMVSTLTLADLGITFYVANRYNLRKALLFFLNPVSIMITGYHNQFDNIAILLALLTIVFYNEEEKFNKKDIGFLVTFTLCLITKHILFLIPVFLLLRKALPWKKKIVYSCVPPFLFLMSFVPFAIGNNAALQGIINNVFLYRSHNNAPLLSGIYELINFPSGPRIFVYAGLMIAVAFLTREYSYEKQIMLYFISMVAFSSAIANQYLVIPMVALCVLDTKWLKYAYMLCIGYYLVLQNDGLGTLGKIMGLYPRTLGKVSWCLVKYGYPLAAWMLLIILFYILAENRKNTIKE